MRNSQVSPEIIVLNDYLQAAFKAETSFNMTNYISGSTAYFTLLSSVGGFTQSGIQDISNAALRLSFSGWQVLLNGKGLSLSDIGFTSYVTRKNSKFDETNSKMLGEYMKQYEKNGESVENADIDPKYNQEATDIKDAIKEK